MSDKKIEFNKVGLSFTEKQLGLALTVDASAEACATATDFYTNSLVTETSAELFNNVPFNKGKKRIPNLTMGHVVKAWSCDFTPGNIGLSAKEVEVTKFAVMVAICISDIEDSFLVDRMLAGANNDVNPKDFLNYVWSEIGMQAGADIEALRWNGNTSLVADPFLKLTNGYLKLLETAPALAAKINAAATINETNVIAEILKVISSVDPINRQDNLRNNLNIFVSSDIALAFQVATSTNTAMGAHITNTGDMFLGRYKLIETPVLPAKTMVASPKQDLVYTYDLLNDKDNFITIDRRNIAAEEYVFFRVNIYAGFDVFDYTNVVYYRPAP